MCRRRTDGLKVLLLVLLALGVLFRYLGTRLLLLLR